MGTEIGFSYAHIWSFGRILLAITVIFKAVVCKYLVSWAKPTHSLSKVCGEPWEMHIPILTLALTCIKTRRKVIVWSHWNKEIFSFFVWTPPACVHLQYMFEQDISDSLGNVTDVRNSTVSVDTLRLDDFLITLYYGVGDVDTSCVWRLQIYPVRRIQVIHVLFALTCTLQGLLIGWKLDSYS